MKYVTTIQDRTYLIEINDDRHVTIDGVTYEVDFESVAGQPVYSLLVNGRSYEALVSLGEETWEVLLHGDLYSAFVEDEREKRLRAQAGVVHQPAGEFILRAPMPGLVVGIPVEEGQPVKKGENLLILESMKMQNELKSPREGTVARVRVRLGENVNQNQPLITLA